MRACRCCCSTSSRRTTANRNAIAEGAVAKHAQDRTRAVHVEAAPPSWSRPATSRIIWRRSPIATGSSRRWSSGSTSSRSFTPSSKTVKPAGTRGVVEHLDDPARQSGRRPIGRVHGAISSSPTSSIRRATCGLLEIVTGPDTDPALADRVDAFADSHSARRRSARRTRRASSQTASAPTGPARRSTRRWTSA